MPNYDVRVKNLDDTLQRRVTIDSTGLFQVIKLPPITHLDHSQSFMKLLWDVLTFMDLVQGNSLTVTRLP